MKNAIILLALFSGLDLVACNKTPGNVVVPVPVLESASVTEAIIEISEKGTSGKSGDEGIKIKPGKAGDQGIQGEPSKSRDNATIIYPPPVANMPPDILPEPSLVKPVN